MNLDQVRERFPNLKPESLTEHHGALFWLQGEGQQKCLMMLSNPASDLLPRFQGEESVFNDGWIVKKCLLTHANAAALRGTLAWLSPQPLGLGTSVGFGDRLGLATAGHVRALRALNARTIAPIFAQQSIREMQRTQRSPDNVLDDATWGAFEEGWRGTLGADADHLKTTADIDACVAAGYTFFTFDPGEFVETIPQDQDSSAIRRKVDLLPWEKLHNTPGGLEVNYADMTVELETRDITLTRADVFRAAAKYGRAIAHVATLYHHLAGKGVPFELEVSVDETESPTTIVEHIFIASELKRLDMVWVSLAPRYAGRFEKGVDFIGSPSEFESSFAVHAEIARVFGPYKLSLHSGSDKFSIYNIAMRHTRGLVHLKTAGTSYLEALRTIAAFEPKLFREIYEFSRSRYETDRATYHVSARLDRAPKSESIHADDLHSLLNHPHARQILHVTYGSVLGARGENGQLRFYHDILAALHAHSDAYATNLEKHFVRHLAPFVGNG